MERLSELRKKLKGFNDEKERGVKISEVKEYMSELKERESNLLCGKLETFANKFNNSKRNSLEETINKLLEKISNLEVIFYSFIF